MGFGWLFIGYFTVTAMSLNAAGVLIRLLGYALILMAMGKLRNYHRAFEPAWWGTVLMLVVSTGLLGLGIAEQFLLVPSGVMTVFGHIEQGAALVFHALMLWAIRQIALETEVPKIAVSAVRNFVFLCIYQLTYIIGALPVPSWQPVLIRVGLVSWGLYFICVILNLILLGSCYARICDEGDVDMEQKPSRFAFINRLREENARRAQKAASETLAYRREREEKRKKSKKGGRS